MTWSEPITADRKGTDPLQEQGVMWDAIRSVDWAGSSLGPIEGWPFTLRAVLRTVLASKQPMCLWWGPDLLQFHNEAYLPMLGARADGAIGKPFSVLWADVSEDVMPYLKQALAGQGTWAEDLPLTVTRNGYPEETYWSFSYSPLFNDHGQIAGALNIVTETTRLMRERQELEELNRNLSDSLARQEEGERQRRVLQRELSHRMKNTLAMVQAVVTQSLRHSTSIEEATQVASARIQALGRAQDMLTATDWTIADLRAAVDAAIEPHVDRSGRFIVSGDTLDLSAQQAMGVALALHELATNAVKYGALSVDEGCVKVGWHVSPEGEFHFEWREENGPEVKPLSRKGFGTRLTERVVPGYFNGRAETDFQPDGIVYRLQGRLEP
ncbi:MULTISPECIES: sensor histidine kinase [unclassified Aureimonas]|uniref:sensor histidine kinase n=1 Tax=unclassified Aureimonas TaxID=2615206 RepID=UPI0007854980|nr:MULTISPECIES: PAS domain-containing sensor histidine kinase [unclassified Aureimonas]